MCACCCYDIAINIAIFRQNGHFAISSASLIFCYVLFVIVAVVLVACPVSVLCWARADLMSPFFIDLINALFVSKILLSVLPTYNLLQLAQGVSYT